MMFFKMSTNLQITLGKGDVFVTVLIHANISELKSTCYSCKQSCSKKRRDKVMYSITQRNQP